MKQISILFLLLLSLAACNRQKNFNDKCLKDAQMENMRYARREVTKGITFDSVVYNPATLTFHRYFSILDSLYSPMTIEANKDKVRQGLLKDIKTSVEYKKLKEHNVTFHYLYLLHNSHAIVLEYSFGPADYKQ